MALPGQRRLPAEWEPQAGVVIAWPHRDTDWSRCLAEAESVYTRFAQAIARFEPVLILVRDPRHRRRVQQCLGNRLQRVRFTCLEYNDTWTRDYGPLTVLEGDRPRLLDFRFDGWGGKFQARGDDAVTAALHRDGVFGATPLERMDFVLEGGTLDSDGAGSLLTTTTCWRARHPELDRRAVAQRLRRWLGADRVLWLEHGRLEGDDTDAHVDTLARFCDPGTLAYQACDDPTDPHHRPLTALGEQLASLRTRDGRAYRLIPLPWPGIMRDGGGRRLPAGYANFLIINRAVLVPTFAVAVDREALHRLQSAFPDREVIGVPSSTLIWQNGGLHCAAMPIPEPVPLRAPAESPNPP